MKEQEKSILLDAVKFRIPPSEKADRSTVDEAFDTLLRERSTGSGEGGQPPVRTEQIREVFRGRESTGVTKEELLNHFGDTTNPEEALKAYIKWLRAAFDNLDAPVKLESVTIKHMSSHKTRTIYYFCASHPHR